jgi:preprotein translocase subunit SecG
METILRIFQVLLAIGLIGVVLLQRSEGGGLGIGSSGGMGSFMSVRGTANFLTRVTSILGGLFMVTCLALALIGHTTEAPRSIFDVPASAPLAPSIPAAPAPGEIPSGTAAAPQAGPAPAATVPAPLAVPPIVATPTPEIPPAPIQTPAPMSPAPAMSAPPAPAPNATVSKAPGGKARKPSHQEAPRPSGQ